MNEYTYNAFRTTVEDHLIIIPQIETKRGLDNVREVAVHELTTALGVGPFDLSAQLGVCGESFDNPRMHEALDQICVAAVESQKPVWMIGTVMR